MTAVSNTPQGEADADVVIVGAGFAGLYMLHRVLQLGLKATVIEAGADVGGTWYWNRYPGARCDVESFDYQYSFAPELARDWTWKERYAAQPEILAYLRYVAERLELRPHIRLDTRVTGAAFDEAQACWGIATDQGETVRARFLIAATGALSVPSRPHLPGLETFAGEVLHTGEWPHEEVDFDGKRVAVIGTGSSGIQVIPLIAEQAQFLHVFQRTPNFSMPANNAPTPPGAAAELKAGFAAMKREARETRSGVLLNPNLVSALSVSPEEREREYGERWLKGGFHMTAAFRDLLTDDAANETLAAFIRGKIGEMVHDPEIARRLTPSGYPCGAKRICLDTGYFATFNRPNVGLVDLREEGPLEVTPKGVRTAVREYGVDTIVQATGFDAMTGALLRIDIRGRGGRPLGEAWAAGPTTYLGLGVAGFPNLLILAGPGSPSVLSNVVMSIEQQVEWVADLLRYMSDRGLGVIEAEPAAQAQWVGVVNEAAARTLYPKAGSWYMGANIPGKPRVFMPYCGGLNTYAKVCREVAARGYDGFQLECSARMERTG